jgi:outer membrane protein assembly factor BamB
LALIELDLNAQPEQALSSPPPARRYRLVGLLFAAVFLVGLGGAAPIVPVLWREVGSVPVIADPLMPFEVVDGQLYTFDPVGETDTSVTAWAVEDEPRRRWTVLLSSADAEPDSVRVGFGGARIDSLGDLVLLSTGRDSTVVDARTGAVRWRSPTRVAPLAGGRIGVVESERFRPDTVYDHDSGRPGPLYFSSTGVPHTEPPLQTEVRGVDLGTGRTVWTASSSGSVNVVPVPGEAPVLLILSSTGIERRDGATGKVVRQVALARDDRPGPIAGELVGDRMMVYYGYESGFVGAYAPDTLAALWSRVVPVPVVDPPECDDVLCAGSRAALDVLDPDTGRPLWRAPKADLARRPGYLVEVGPTSGQPLRLVDPATGRGRVDLTGWQAEVPDSAERVIVLRRVEEDQRSTVFGVVNPRRDEVQPLGRADRAFFECTADPGHVVCRDGDTLRVWAYRA